MHVCPLCDSRVTRSWPIIFVFGIERPKPLHRNTFSEFALFRLIRTIWIAAFSLFPLCIYFRVIYCFGKSFGAIILFKVLASLVSICWFYLFVMSINIGLRRTFLLESLVIMTELGLIILVRELLNLLILLYLLFIFIADLMNFKEAGF